MQNCFDK